MCTTSAFDNLESTLMSGVVSTTKQRSSLQIKYLRSVQTTDINCDCDVIMDYHTTVMSNVPSVYHVTVCLLMC